MSKLIRFAPQPASAHLSSVGHTLPARRAVQPAGAGDGGLQVVEQLWAREGAREGDEG